MVKIGRQRFEEFVFRVGRDKLYAAYNHGDGTVYVNVDPLTARTIKASVGIGTRVYIPVKSAEVQDNLSTVVDKAMPERVIRPLTRIKDPDEQREVYQRAVETARRDAKTTSASVRKTGPAGRHDKGYD